METRNVALLAGAQALLLSAIVGSVAVSTLAGRFLAPEVSLATLPITALVLGPFLASWPASLLMARHGRRAGFMVGALFGVAGGLLAALAVGMKHFELFCLGHLLVGVFQGFGGFHRFAAGEAAKPANQARAMGWVIGGGVIAAIAGPALAHATVSVGGVPFQGSYLCVALLSVAYVLCVWPLRLPRPLAKQDGHRAPARPLLEIMATRQFISAISAAAMAYAVMVLAMTATPLAMVNCGLGLVDTRSVIQWHVLGMFVPSFFTGRIIQRLGASWVALGGVGLLSLAIAVAAAGVSQGHFTAALTLLGIGWNFAFLGGTALLGQAHRPEEAAKVQAANELIVSGVAAVASLSSGVLLQHVGWVTLNYLLLLPVAAALLALMPAAAASLRARMQGLGHSSH